MIRRGRIKDLLLVLAGVVVGGLLCGSPTESSATAAEQRKGAFVSAITQRKDMIDQLKKLNQQLADQTTFLKSGKLKTVTEAPNEQKPK